MTKGAFRQIFFLVMLLFPSFSPALTGDMILQNYPVAEELPLGERIAFWAELFVGTPYDTDPEGAYVRRRVIVADDRVDCMYLVFRSVELAVARDPEAAEEAALTLRFHRKGKREERRVMNYEDRFRYGEDMISSGKWGQEITAELGKVETVRGDRGRTVVELLTPHEALKALPMLKSGDIIFFVKKAEKRISGEIIGHMGIVKTGPEGTVWLIHAGGLKGKRAAGGSVKKVLLKDYLETMPFAGIEVTRFP